VEGSTENVLLRVHVYAEHEMCYLMRRHSDVDLLERNDGSPASEVAELAGGICAGGGHKAFLNPADSAPVLAHLALVLESRATRHPSFPHFFDSHARVEPPNSPKAKPGVDTCLGSTSAPGDRAPVPQGGPRWLFSSAAGAGRAYTRLQETWPASSTGQQAPVVASSRLLAPARGRRFCAPVLPGGDGVAWSPRRPLRASFSRLRGREAASERPAGRSRRQGEVTKGNSQCLGAAAPWLAGGTAATR